MTEILSVPPARPRIHIAGRVYEIVEPATLPELLDELRRFIFAQEQLSMKQRLDWFARAVAAAAVNALLDEPR